MRRRSKRRAAMGDGPGREVLERPPDGEPRAPDAHRFQHARVSELVQHQRLVEVVGHLQTISHIIRK